ncbi:hypothetical protein BDQ12DRAFT_689472 [Crucibulum laeve]|uniref:Uncharacterized protein n=1 Tax=Crucibulum laeve TaxID=68775 RepID=A0A5C3LQG0_9AGAR|nr:hypothetical protein BDQ12DRAFT_689472 [Crucibulum laeve]
MTSITRRFSSVPYHCQVKPSIDIDHFQRTPVPLQQSVHSSSSKLVAVPSDCLSIGSCVVLRLAPGATGASIYMPARCAF